MITIFRSRPLRFNSISVVSGISFMMLIAIFLFSSCVNDLNRGASANPDVDPITVSIGFSAPKMKKKTALRSELASDEEKTIKNLYLIIFDNKGKRFSYAYDKRLITPTGNVVAKNVELFPNVDYVFCLISNVDLEQNVFSNTTLAQLNSIDTYETFKSYRVSLLQNSVQRINANMLMVGEKNVKLSPSKVSTDITISLLQINAKVRVIINTENDVSFKAKSWSVYNVPKSIELGLSQKNGSLSGKDNYFDIVDQPFESISFRSDRSDNAFGESDGATGFSFYILPNTKATRGKALLVNEYKKREMQVKTPTETDYPTGGKYVTNGDFVHADPYATYIVITGDYRGLDPSASGSSVSYLSARDARYVIHLGGVSNEGNEKNENKYDVNNWEVNRNTSYTYKITIKGINEVVTEVVKDDEVNTGVEAKVLKESDHTINVDAPFATAVIYLNGNEFNAATAAAKADKLKFKCFTPYDNGGQEDYDWVRFIIHKDSPSWATSNEVDQTNPAQSSLIPYSKSNFSRLLTIKELIKALKDGYVDIDGERQNLYYRMVLSVYINEFYYKDKPKDVKFDGDWGKDGWRTFVNQPDRKLYLYWDDNGSLDRLSRDTKSSLTDPKIAIIQKSILTPYSLDDNVFKKGQIAIGMEAVQEPASHMEFNNALHFGGNTDDKDLWNGVKNMYNALLSSYFGNNAIKISDYLRIVNDQYVLSSSNKFLTSFKAQVECLKMNRDLNGNGKIEDVELKWYTPAIFEYIVLGGLGNLSIPIDARLAPKATYNNFYHYTTSTRSGHYRYNRLAYFAEQMLCYNEQIYSGMVRKSAMVGDQSLKFDYVTKENYYGTQSIYYRCVRHLGDSPTEPLKKAMEPMKLISNKPPYEIESYFDGKSIRPESMFLSSGELPVHYDYSVFNRPVRRFYVAQHTLNSKDSRGYLYHDALHACEGYTEMAGGSDKGWRMPNAKELQMMLQIVVDPDKSGAPFAGDRLENYEMGWLNMYGEYNRENPGGSFQNNICYWSSTLFSTPAPDGSISYVYGLTKGILLPLFSLIRPSNAKGYVRCVKDAR